MEQTVGHDDATTPFARVVDVDDTIPVALYSRPYERIELVARAVPRAAPQRSVPRALLALLLAAAFACGFATVVLIA